MCVCMYVCLYRLGLCAIGKLKGSVQGRIICFNGKYACMHVCMYVCIDWGVLQLEKIMAYIHTYIYTYIHYSHLLHMPSVRALLAWVRQVSARALRRHTCTHMHTHAHTHYVFLLHMPSEQALLALGRQVSARALRRH